MNQLNSEVEALTVMLGFYRMQLKSCEKKQVEYVKSKISAIEEEISIRLEKLE